MNSILEGETVKRIAIALGIIALLFLAVKTAGEIKSFGYIGREADPKNVVTVSGDGEAYAVPDTATFSFSIIEEAKTVVEAQAEATQKMNDAIAYLKAEGLEDTQIKTVGYNVYPKYEYQNQACTQFGCPPGRERIVGYEVSQTIEVKMKDTEKAGTLLSGVGSIGASNVSGLSFTVEDEDALRRDARAQAILEARQNAELLAADLGVDLVRIVSFNENGGDRLYYAKEVMAQSYDSANAAGGPAPVLPTGENKITSQVTISYEIN